MNFDYFFFIKFQNGKVMAKRGLTQKAAERLYKFYTDNCGGFLNVGYRPDNGALSNAVLLKNAEIF